jgi:hypothetical protein
MATFQSSVIAFQAAKENEDGASMMMALRTMSTHLFNPLHTEEDRRVRVGVYGFHRGQAGAWVQAHTPDWESILEDMGDPGNYWRAVHYVTFIRNPLATEYQLYWRRDGKARRADLLVHYAEVKDNIKGRAASWRYAIINCPPCFIPGDKKVIVITDRLSAGDVIFNVSLDGDNMYGSAGRSFLPLRVIHEEERTEFFSLRNRIAWENRLESIKANVTKHHLDQIILMIGHRDVAAMLTMLVSDSDVFLGILDRLVEIQRVCGVEVCFGGVPVLGDLVTRAFTAQVNWFFWEKTVEMRSRRIRFLDCCTPSPLASLEDIFRVDGQLRSAFKAASFYALSRLSAMSLGNLVSPVPSVMAVLNEMRLFRAWGAIRANFEFL